MRCAAAYSRRVGAGEVAGLLVLLGVVGVLTAIVGSGIEAGPVKFPAIPGSRQKPLAVASVLVAAGGLGWWVVQQRSGSEGGAETTVATEAARTSHLRISLIPAESSVRVGDTLAVRAEVYDSRGQQLGRGQCQLDWRDEATGWNETTPCVATASEPSVTKPGPHRVTAQAEGLAGLDARGSGAVRVTVRS